MNAQQFNVYVSINAVRTGVRARTKDAIGAVRHVFVEADEDGPGVVARVGGRRDLPAPSYLIHSSPNRVHVLWRAVGFRTDNVEALQKRLALELGTDLAATPCSQTTRLPGYMNHKHSPGHLVTVEYRDVDGRHPPNVFPTATASRNVAQAPVVHRTSLDALERARRYLAKVDPAVSGRHGDLHTFRVCCRVVRGFALHGDDAFAVLTEWNLRCEPPWTERDLRDKISRAAKYGREPIGALR